MALSPGELLEKARRAVPGTFDWVLYTAAAFDALVESRLVLVGGAAQVVHTKEHRPTDIDMVGPITSRDERALADAGFVREGRHWAYDWSETEGFLVEVPGTALWDEETAEEIDVGGHGLRVVSANDLMVDRLTQATDGTQITWDEVLSLADATWDRVNWDLVRSRCMSKRREDLGLHNLPDVLDKVLAAVGHQRDIEGSRSSLQLDL